MRDAPLDRAWALPAGRVLEFLEVAPETGLDPAEVARRRAASGPNMLREPRRISAWQVLLAQFRSLVVALLGAAALVSFAAGEWIEGVAIGVVVLLNAAIGFVTELRAVRSMEALRRLGRAQVRVRRGGQDREIPASELVPGDIVPLEAGDIVTADLRLLEASKLEANESTLTGESEPVGKRSDPQPADTTLAERASMLFKGTAVTRGAGLGVVVATGMATELGRIAALAEDAEQTATPLERRLEALGRRLIWITLLIAAVTAAAGILRGKEMLLMIETAIALAVAAVPEGLPIVATLALARGMWRMAGHNVLINRLSAVETLGATGIIFSDKTGTLTENRMTVARIALPDGDVSVEDGLDRDDPALRRALEAGVLCNNASLQASGDGLGDPLEIALLAAGRKAGLRRADLVEAAPEVREEAFDPERRMMATFHETGDGFRVAVKGAAESVLACSLEDEAGRARWLERAEAFARAGLRVLGLAERRADSADEDPYRGLTFLGLAAMRDPPREEVAEALAAARTAGVRVIMVTGDHADTALSIAGTLGLVEDGAEVVLGRDLAPLERLTEEDRERLRSAPIFARVEPKQKLDLIDLHQRTGAIVAMTGDGVNDAPALTKADIGVAMGRRGTEVAREAADMILRDDAFSSIVHAIRHGRVIFANIRRFVFFLMSCNLSEIAIVFGASALNVPLPLLPLQILYLNLVTDVFPALALGLGEGDPGVMRLRPRDPKEPILTRRHWTAIALYAAVFTGSVLAALLIGLDTFGFSTRRAVTVSFLTLAFAQVWHVFNMRDRRSSPLWNDVVRNPWVWGAIALCAALLLAAVYLPVLARVLHTSDPGATGWMLALALSLVPLLVGQVALAWTAPNRVQEA